MSKGVRMSYIDGNAWLLETENWFYFRYFGNAWLWVTFGTGNWFYFHVFCFIFVLFRFILFYFVFYSIIFYNNRNIHFVNFLLNDP